MFFLFSVIMHFSNIGLRFWPFSRATKYLDLHEVYEDKGHAFLSCDIFC